MIQMYYMTQSYAFTAWSAAQQDSATVRSLFKYEYMRASQCTAHIHVSRVYLTSRNRTGVETHLRSAPSLIHTCAMTHTCYICGMTLSTSIRMCAMTYSYVRHKSLISVPWLIHICDTTLPSSAPMKTATRCKRWMKARGRKWMSNYQTPRWLRLT